MFWLFCFKKFIRKFSDGSGHQSHNRQEHADASEPTLRVPLRLLEQVHLHRDYPIRHDHGK